MASQNNGARWLFPLAFAFSCCLFWWIPSVLLALLHIPDPIQRATIVISAIALAVFLAGYLVPQRLGHWHFVNLATMDLCEELAYKATWVLAIPAFIVGLSFAAYRAGQAYGEGQGIPLLYQVFLYLHLFVGYFYLGTVSDLEGRNRRRVLFVVGLLIFPRLMISLHWGRFFVGQTVVAILLIAMGRRWLRLSFSRWAQLGLLAAAIVIIPAATRGDKLTGQGQNGVPAFATFLQDGDTLFFFQEDRDFRPQCPVLLVSLTAKTIPYTWFHFCTVSVGDVKYYRASLGTLLTRRYSNDLLRGTGCNYLLELYYTGGLPVVFLGSAIFGLTCRWFVEHLGHRSLVSGIWAECLVRALFAPRGELGYVYERIPSLLLATLAVVVLCRSVEILGRPPVALNQG